MSNKSQTFIKDSYTAGLIDGEGSITLSVRKKGCYRAPVVSMTSTSYELVEFLKETYGGSISIHKTYKEHHKTSWSWKIAYDNSLIFLNKIKPYLRESSKLRRCKYILTFYKKYTPRNGRYSEKLLRKKEQFERVFFYL